MALTGNGNVSQGALSLLEELPIKQVRVNDLEKLAISPGQTNPLVVFFLTLL